MKKKIIFIAAARPNFMKIGPILNCLKNHPHFETLLVHTGQHYDKNMSDTFFEQLNIPHPNIHLEIGSGSHAEQTGKTMIAFEKVCEKEKPNLVVVVGDVNATAACAITAKKCHTYVAHIEAGLRSFDKSMPEEINRMVTDSISDILYTTCKEANRQLIKEGISKEKITLSGNLMIDTLLNQKEKAKQNQFYKSINVSKNNYVLLTLHRPSTVDNPKILIPLIESFLKIAIDIPIVFPVHPRTKKQLQQSNHYDTLKNTPEITLLNPIGYHEMLNLTINSLAVFTDSGGLQEETTVLGIPCLTLRENTERPITISEGSNTLVGTGPHLLIKAFNDIIQAPKKTFSSPKLWDGKASNRILEDLLQRSEIGEF